MTVSYTHLDVYKRQTLGPAENDYEAAWSSPEIDDEDYTAYVNLRVATADSQRCTV